MKLHEDETYFCHLVEDISSKKGSFASYIEKDYYVTLFLKKDVDRVASELF